MSVAVQQAMVHARGITKRFGRSIALRGIDLDLAAGERVALFGPNGSGKTTLLRLLAGLVPPSAGALQVAGRAYSTGGQDIRARIGVVSHHTYLYDDLTGEENLLFYGRMFGIGPLRERVAEVLALAGLQARAGDKVGAYSRGMQQRLALARAVIHDPDLLLLDEPETGLDQEASASIDGFLDRLHGSPRTVVMATHDLGLGHSRCGRFVILAEGRIACEGRRDEVDPAGLEELYRRGTRRV